MIKRYRYGFLYSILLFAFLSVLKFRNVDEKYFLRNSWRKKGLEARSDAIRQPFTEPQPGSESKLESELRVRIVQAFNKLNASFSSSNGKKTVRYKCYKSEQSKNYGIPEDVNAIIPTWFSQKPNATNFPKHPAYTAEFVKARVAYSSESPESSKVEKIGDYLYKLSHFCIEPRSHGGIIMFMKTKDGKKFSDFRVCTEYSCHPWTYTVKQESPPKDVQWISSASAIIPLFTGSNPWHTVHTLFPMAEFFRHPQVDIRHGNAHLFPVFSRIGFRDRYKDHRGYALGYHTFRFWSLVYASAPPNISLTHVRLFENTSFASSLSASVPRLCYESGYFGNLFLDKGKFKRGRFSRPSFKPASDWYISNIVNLIGAEKLSSDWCGQLRREGEGVGKRGKPRMLMVIRNTTRRICNIGKLINASREMGYDVKLARFERMTLEEQIRAVRLSDVLFGMHGAGLTNVLWTHKGSILIEIYPSDSPRIVPGIDVNPTSNYGALAYMVGTRHVAYLDPSIPNFKLFWRSRDVNLDVHLFKLYAKYAFEYIKRNRVCS